MCVLVCWVMRLGYIYSNAYLLQGSKTVLCLLVACTVRLLVRIKIKAEAIFLFISGDIVLLLDC